MGAPALPATRAQFHYDESRTWFRRELDFPGPRTMQATADWVDENAAHFDRFLLFVDEFDPHEPFDTPAPWVNRYDDTWQGDVMIWPPYARCAASSAASSRSARRATCAATTVRSSP